MNWRACTHGQASNRPPKARRRRDCCCSSCCTVGLAMWPERGGPSSTYAVLPARFLTSISKNIGLEDPVVCAGSQHMVNAPCLPVSNTSRNPPEGSTNTGHSRRQPELARLTYSVRFNSAPPVLVPPSRTFGIIQAWLQPALTGMTCSPGPKAGRGRPSSSPHSTDWAALPRRVHLTPGR
jgi:hypothetical protein